MADTKLRATLEFVLDANARRSIRDAVTRATSDLEVRIERARLGNKAQADLQRDVERSTSRASGASQNLSRSNSRLTQSAQRLNEVQRRLNQTQTVLSRSVESTAIRLRALREQYGITATQAKRVSDSNKLVQSSFQGSGLSLESFGARLLTITARFGTYLVAIRAILAAQQAFRASLDTIVEFDGVLQDLQKILNTTPEGLAEVSDQLFGVAQATGRAVGDVAESFGTFVRQGLEVEEALKRAQAALTATSISTLSQDEATKLITSSLQIFGDQLRDSNDVLDLISVTGDRAATNQTAIAQALIRTAGAADTAGVGFRELIALIAATIERTQEAAGKVGTAFKTILTRIQSNRDAFIDQANALGANIAATDDLVTIFGKLNSLFENLNDVQKTQLATQVAGQRRVNIFVGLVESFNRALALQEDQLDATGAAQRKLNIEQGKLSTQAQNLVTNFQDFVVALSGTDEGADAVGGIRQSLAGVLSILNDSFSVATDFVQSIREAEAFGIRLSSVFGGIGKLAFFAGGAAIIRAIVRGISSAVSTGRQLTTEAANISKALRTATGQVQQQDVAEKKVLETEKQREGVLRRILNLSRQIAGTTGRNLGQDVRNVRAGNLNSQVRSAGAASTAVVVATSILVDSLRSLSAEIEESADAQARASANFTKASTEIVAGSAELGTTLGILSGSIRVGILAAVINAGIQLNKFANEQARNSAKLLAAAERQAGDTVNFARVLAIGSEDIERAFRQLAAESGRSVEEFTASLALLTQIGERGLNVDIERNLAETANVLDLGRRRLSGAVDAFQGLEQQARQAAQFQQRQEEARLAAEGGALGGRFGEIDRILAQTNVQARQLVGNIDEAGGLAQVLSRAQALVDRRVKDSSVSARELTNTFLLQSPQLQQLKRDLEDQNSLLREQEDRVQAIRQRIESLNRERDRTNAALEEQNKLISEGAFEGQEDARAQLTQTLRNQTEALNAARADENKLAQSTQQIRGQAVEIERQIENASQNSVNNARDLVNSSGSLLELQKTITAELQAQSASLSENQAELEDQIQFEFELIRARSDGLTAQERLNEIQSRAARSVEQQLRAEERGRARVVQRLREQGESFRLIDPQRSRELEQAAAQLEEAFERQRPEIEAQIRAQVQVEVERDLENFIKEQEKVLADSRIAEIRRITQAEQQAADRRVEALRRLGNSRVGLQVFERTLRNIPDQAAREFGRVNEAILRIQEEQVNRFAGGTIQELRELERVGISSSERLREAQERQAAILERSQAQVENRRESVLGRVQEASERVNQSEQRLLNVRNQIPQANARIIQTQRNLAAAEKSVEEATGDLLGAFQEAADAQAALSFQSQLAVFQVRQQTVAFQSVGQQFAELARIFTSTNAEIRASEEQRLQFAKQIADAQLNILQQQFSNVQNLGVRAATASADQLAELQNAVGAAAAIAGGADISQFAPEVLQAVAGLGDLFPGLQRALAEFGLQELGLDPSTLDNIEQEMIELARISAESGQEQVIAANEQVRVAQQQLSQAEADRSLAQDQLTVAQDQKEVLLQQVAVAQAGVAASRLGFSQTVGSAARTLERLEGQIFATKEVEVAVRDLGDIIREQRADIQSGANEARAELGLQPLNEQVEATVTQLTGFQTEIERVKIATDLSATAREQETITIGGVTVSADEARTSFVNAAVEIDSFARKISGIDFSPLLSLVAAGRAANIPNNARGSLSSGEMAGVLAAARREKRAMPAGSNLMVANTSETVLTRRQARLFGLRPVVKSNAQDGNAASDSLAQTVQALNNGVQNLSNALNNPTLVNQDINVTVDTQRTVNVRGVDAVNSAVRDLLQDRFSDMASTEEVGAIGDAVAGLIQKLNEEGLVTSGGS